MSEIAVEPRRRGRPPGIRSEPAGEVQSLERAVSLIEALAASDGLALSDLSRRVELPTSTVHRLLATLQRRGLVSHDPETGLWAVGVGLFRIGASYLRIRKLPDIGRPIIRALLSEVDETVNLTSLDGRELVCVAQAESHAAVRAFFRLGRRLPLHASAGGKAILAAADRSRREFLLAETRYERFTPNTLASPRALAAELRGIAVRGWAVDEEEHTLGMRCVAAAILDEQREPIGAISISAPTIRVPPERLQPLGDIVKDAAHRLTTLYSGLRPSG